MLFLAVGCSQSPATSRLPDGGRPAKDAAPNTIPSSSGTAASCKPKCGPPAECSLGRCVSPTCATIEQRDAARGCLFYGFRADNIDTDVDRPTMLAISSASDSTADVRVEGRGGEGGWSVIATARIAAHSGERVSLTELPPALRGAGRAAQIAFRVVSSEPVIVVQLTSDDVDRASSSSGGTALRPLQSLGVRHLAIAYAQLASASASQAEVGGTRAGAGTLVVIATDDDTTVTLTPSADTLVGPGALDVAPAGTPCSFQLSDGDAVQVYSAAGGGDLTGTLVESNHPVAAFSGNVYSTYGAPITGFNGGDLAIEQLPPVESWASEYVGAWLSPQANCDPFFGPESGLWTVMAAEPDTAITISPAANVTLTVEPTFTLGGGQARTFRVQGVAAGQDGSPAVPGDFYISGGQNRILLAQWLDCEPGLSFGVDTRYGPSELNFVLPPNFDHEIVVVRERQVPVILDNTVDLGRRFTSTVNGGRYEIGRITQRDLGPCRDLLDDCTHVLGTGAFGVSIRGMDVVCSYALTVPSRGSGCALPSTACPL